LQLSSLQPIYVMQFPIDLYQLIKRKQKHAENSANDQERLSPSKLGAIL